RPALQSAGGSDRSSGLAVPEGWNLSASSHLQARQGVAAEGRIPAMTVRYGRYEVVRKLGEGAMAAVHLGRDPVLMRFVAVKVLHPGVAAGKVALRRFHNEARTVAGIRSPHVVDV